MRSSDNIKIKTDFMHEIKKNKWRKSLSMIGIYGMLIVFGFVFIYPLVYMILTSLMPSEDVFNPLINIVPSRMTTTNYAELLARMELLSSLGYSLFLTGISSLLSTLACGLMGYGLSRFEFKMKKFFLALVLIVFIIPTQVLVIPTFLTFAELNLLGSPLAFFIPAGLGQGFQSSIFILIFYSFFNTIPTALDEAASIDGCSPLKTFLKIILPLSVPILVLVFIFSLVWYWNETYLMTLYLGDASGTFINQVSVAVSRLSVDANQNPMGQQINLPVMMAAACLIIAPLLIGYLFLQKQFVESVDKTGLTGE